MPLIAALDVKDSRAALWTEREPTPSAFVTNTGELSALALDAYGFPREPCLSAEHAAGSTLTGVTVADRDANGLARDFSLELATTAGGGASGHDEVPMRLLVALTRRAGSILSRSVRLRQLCHTEYLHLEHRCTLQRQFLKPLKLKAGVHMALQHFQTTAFRDQ